VDFFFEVSIFASRMTQVGMRNFAGTTFFCLQIKKYTFMTSDNGKLSV
jgi:hypothetical protein